MALHALDIYDGERILVTGPSGSGKSTNFYTIARLAARTKSDATFYVVDTDRSAARMISDKGFRQYLLTEDGQRTNIVVQDVRNWQQLIDALTVFQDKMQPQDWLMIDLLTPTWQWAQDEYIREIYGQDRSKYFLTVRAAQVANPNDKELKQKRGGFEGFGEWPVINSIWGDLRDRIIRGPGNLYATAGIKAFSSEKASPEAKATFSRFGVMPAGQKDLAFDFQTVLWSRQSPDGIELTSLKDRARDDLMSTPVGIDNGDDFAQLYLVGTAGWRLA